MVKTVKEIASEINAKVIGDASAEIKGVCGIKEAQPGDITFLANLKYKTFLEKTAASAIIVSEEIKIHSKTLLVVQDPSTAFTKVISMLLPSDLKHPEGIDKKAIIKENVRLGKNAAISANTFIDEGVECGDNVVIYPNCFIGRNVKIGNNTLIYPNVTIREASQIGNNVIIQSGTVVGSDGFGYVEIDGKHCKIPQTGIVVIEDDVEIGANVAIDRARFGKTLICKGTKIDNLVQIAHNVCIGPNSIVVSQVGISGSTKLGKNVILAGQAGLVGHIELGDNVIVGAQAGVSKSVPKDTIVLGSPAKPIQEQKKLFVYISKLPELFETVKQLKKKIFKDEDETKNH